MVHYPVIVLGDNLYSFVSAIFIKDAVVIGNRPFFFPFRYRTRLIRDCEPNKILLQELLIEIPERKIRYGYFVGNDFSFPTKRLAKELYSIFRLDKEPTDIWMQNHAEEFFVIDITEDEIAYLCYSILLTEGRIMYDKIKRINILKKEIYGKHQTYSYDNLIVSIPAPEFLKLAGIQIEDYRFVHAVKYYALLPINQLPSKIGKKIKDLDYAYLIDIDLPFYRISNTGSFVICETYAPIDDYRYIWEEKYGILIDSKWNPTDLEMLNIYFVGREAKFQEEYYIQNGVADILRIKKKIQKE